MLNTAAVGSLVVLLSLAMNGCATAPKNAKTPAPSAEDENFIKVAGKVVETANAGGYTYVCLEKGGKKIWAAIPTMQVKVGEEMELMPGGEMKGFTSASLGRTFDSIIFSGGPIDAAHAPKAAAQPAQSAQATQSSDSQNKVVKANVTEKPILAGKVVETMGAGNYTYLQIEKDGKKGWAAVPATKVNVGDEVELQPGTEMGEFTSNTLKRTFPSIYFSGGIKGAKVEQPAKEEAKAAEPHASAKPAPAAMPEPVKGKVVETMNSGGYSYVCVENQGSKTWLAVPAMKVTVGETMAFQPGMTMSNFTSKSLNRTFDKIIFSNGPAGN
ncbi:GW dipeptide domain-containing protein [Geomesophilobacter sediminis]|uniref:SH3-like domain-containing protein n=1 Tax=Geomesophilobacter sediminis TaxID=2798584 RepID=A0A8J7M249_9BACT|nr:GW dipeptide domain-containing protein [Geomesophilobacter sediminis]MBJ6727328.1 SH3-like domain-containing protein [Geomesophilobacter sediminis]